MGGKKGEGGGPTAAVVTVTSCDELCVGLIPVLGIGNNIWLSAVLVFVILPILPH